MTEPNEIQSAPSEERGIPSVRTKKQTKSKKLGLLVVVVAALAIALGSVAVFVKQLTDMKLAEKAAERDKPKETASAQGDYGDLQGQKKRIEDEEAQTKAAAAGQAAGAAAPGGLPTGGCTGLERHGILWGRTRRQRGQRIATACRDARRTPAGRQCDDPDQSKEPGLGCAGH